MKASFESYLRANIEENPNNRVHYAHWVGDELRYGYADDCVHVAAMATPALTARALLQSCIEELEVRIDVSTRMLVDLESELIDLKGKIRALKSGA